MYKVCGLPLGPYFVVQLTAEKNFYLRLTIEKMRPFAVFTEKYLGSYGCKGTIFTATLNYRNLKLKYKLKPSKSKSLGYKSTL